MKSASVGSRAIVAKAASISRLVLALSTRICRPRAGAASDRARTVASAFAAGLTSTATRTALGIRSCRRPSRLATSSPKKKLKPVALPPRPGEARHETELDRVFGDAEDDRDRRGRRFGGARGLIVASARNDGNATADEVAHERWELIISAAQPVVLDRHVLAFDKAAFAASAAGLLPGVAMTATRRRTKSLMTDGRRSYFPPNQ